MAPELVEEFVRAAQTEINQLRREDEVVREVKKRELVQQRLNELEGAAAPYRGGTIGRTLNRHHRLWLG